MQIKNVLLNLLSAVLDNELHVLQLQLRVFLNATDEFLFAILIVLLHKGFGLLLVDLHIITNLRETHPVKFIKHLRVRVTLTLFHCIDHPVKDTFPDKTVATR